MNRNFSDHNKKKRYQSFFSFWPLKASRKCDIVYYRDTRKRNFAQQYLYYPKAGAFFGHKWLKPYLIPFLISFKSSSESYRKSKRSKMQRFIDRNTQEIKSQRFKKNFWVSVGFLAIRFYAEAEVKLCYELYKGRRKYVRKIRGTGEKRVGAGVFAAFRLKHSLRLCIAAINFNHDMYYKIIRSFKLTRFYPSGARTDF